MPSLVVLLLELDRDSYSSYGVVLQNADGAEILRVEDIKSQTSGNRRWIIVSLSSQSLKTGGYLVKLFADHEQSNLVDGYPLSVIP